MARIDLEAYRAREAQGLISCRAHPDADLFIWNYTSRCQYAGAWDEVTMAARGLITRSDGTIIARPFPKFRNLNEHRALGLPVPAEPFEVTEKMDGSLGILYWLDGAPAIATRGSFTSEQAIHASALLRERYGTYLFDPALTLLFEIVYPENRIVIDYGALDDLVLLAAIEIETGREVALDARAWPFPLVKRYDGIADVAQLAALDEPNREGFVLRFASGLRLKVKFREYTRLHHLLTGVTARDVWETLATGAGFDALIDRVPDEFYRWVSATRDELLARYTAVEAECQACRERAAALPTRKEQAAVVSQPGPHMTAVVFRMLDGKPYADLIWRHVRPVADVPFAQDEA